MRAEPLDWLTVNLIISFLKESSWTEISLLSDSLLTGLFAILFEFGLSFLFFGVDWNSMPVYGSKARSS